MAAPTTVTRITLFKIANPEHIALITEAYNELKATALKDNAPYITTITYGPLTPDPRSQGFTFFSKTVFASEDDHAYYDTQCAAHAALKKTVVGGGWIDGMPCTIRW